MGGWVDRWEVMVCGWVGRWMGGWMGMGVIGG